MSDPARLAPLAGDGIDRREPSLVVGVDGHLSAMRTGSSGGLKTDADPSPSFVPITKDNDFLYVPPLRGLYVGTAGDVVLLGLHDQTPVTFRNCPAGFVIPGVIAKVLASGTSADDLVGLR